MIRAVGFFDTWALSSTLYARYRDRFVAADSDGLEMFVVDAELLSEWKSLKAFLVKLKAAATPQLGYAPEVSKVVVARLSGPKGYAGWASDETDVVRLHTCLVPSNTAYVYSGPFSANLGVGIVNFVDHKVLNSWANFGDQPQVQIIVELKKPDEADD